MRPLIFDMAEVLSDASSGSAPPSPSVPTAAGVEKLPVPGESTSATASAGAGRPAEENSQKDNTPGSQGQGVEKCASREKSAKKRERAVKAAEEAVREAAAQLAAVRGGPPARAEADKSLGATPPKKAKLTFVTGPERSARAPAGVQSHTGGPATSDATSGQVLGGSSTDSALVGGASLARKDDIQVVTHRGDGTEKPLASVPGPAPSGDQAERSALPFGLDDLSISSDAWPFLDDGFTPSEDPVQQGSLPSSIDLTGTGAFPRAALLGVATSSPSPGSVALTAVLDVRPPAAPGTVYPVPEGFVDHEILTELGQPIMNAPVLDASKLALRRPCRPRRGISVVELEKPSGDGPIRADMSRLMKVRSCNPGRADAAVDIMMAHGRYATPPALECNRTFLHEPRDTAYLELTSAMLLGRPGGKDVGEIFPMAMLSSWCQFPLPVLPTTLDVATHVIHGVRQLFRAR